ncbi:hypothetical protein F3Y22_tig00116997pilonHSYRG00778 [Hibiscus syriacus]|uniref:HAT C-terminal dimerisation domain-containing protein n=1 Tax=Hibiscus syriacus TaxID=106335 RepID=A0A6A2WFE8_HIBSY|nr:hypothetical protein F3Y22_tig00116997pilonHSYRG00778 [Hibiscus syriacus]
MSSSTSTSLFNFTQGETQSGGKIDLQQLMASKFQRDTGCLLTSANKNELEKYLEDACESHVLNFDILQWWKDQPKRYPLLRRMAKDVLVIPISTVASESTFSTGGHVHDSFRTSLTPKIVEALFCTQDWLRTSRIEENVKDNYYRPDLTEAALARLSAVHRSPKVAKSGVKKKNRQGSWQWQWQEVS